MKKMPVQQLPADEEWLYVPADDNWIVQKKSGNVVLSKKEIKADFKAECPLCGKLSTTNLTPEERAKGWECEDCYQKMLSKNLTNLKTPAPHQERGSKVITQVDPEFEWLMKLINVVTKVGVPASEIKALSQSHPFKTIDDAGDLAAQIWTLATEKYGIPRDWLIKKMPEKKSSLNKQAETIEGHTYGKKYPFPIKVNPTYNEALGLMNKAEHKTLRYLLDEDNNLFVWDSYYATHDHVRGELINFGYNVAQDVLNGHLQDEDDVRSILGSLSKKAYEGGYPTEEDSVQWGMAPVNTYSDEPEINHDYPMGEREGDTGEPIVICPTCKSDKIAKEGEQVKCQACGTNFIPEPDRGSDSPDVNDYSQNYFWGPNDLGRSHQNQPGANGWLPAGTEDMDGPSPNVRMSSLGKNAYGVGQYWIDPNGKSYKVPGTHTAWAGRNAEKLNKKFGYNLPLGLKEGHQYTDMLIDLGWARITSSMGNQQFVVDVKDINNIPSGVNNFIDEHFANFDNPIPIWIVSATQETIVIYDPFPTIQDAVNKAKHEPKMSSFKSFMHKQSVLNRIAYTVNLWPTIIDDSEIRKHFTDRDIDLEEVALKLPIKITYIPKTIDLGDSYAAYSAKDKAIYVNTGISWPDLRSSLIHELEHALQDYVGILPSIKERAKSYFERPQEWSARFQEVKRLRDRGFSKEDVLNFFVEKDKKRGLQTFPEILEQLEHLYDLTGEVEPASIIGTLKQAHCGPCSVLKMEALHILIDLYYKDNDLFHEEVIEELSLAATELKIDNFNDILESVIAEYLEEKSEEVGEKLPKLKNLLIALKDIAPKLGKEIKVVDTQESVEKEADLKEYSTPETRKMNDWIISHGDILHYVIEWAKKASSEEELVDIFKTGPLSRIAEDELGMYSYQIRWDELAYAFFNSVKREPVPYEGKAIDIENLPTLDKAKKLDELLEQLSAETDPQKKERIKQHIERIKNASLNKQANPPSRFWIAPDGKEFDAGSHHGVWIKQNLKVLKQYGIDVSPENTLDEIWNDMISKGWARISNEPAGAGFNIEVLDIEKIPSYLDNFIAKNFSEGDEIYISSQTGHTKVSDPFPSIQKAVKKELMHSKQASLLDEVLDQTTQDAIAAEYGPSMLISLRFYNDAVRYGQSPDRAIRYALEEVKRMRRPIEQKNFLEVLNTYF